MALEPGDNIDVRLSLQEAEPVSIRDGNERLHIATLPS